LAGTVRLPLDASSGIVTVVVGSVLVDPKTGRASRLGRMGGLTPLRDPHAAPELVSDGQMCGYDRWSGAFDVIGYEGSAE
jgi:hypothetical protein